MIKLPHPTNDTPSLDELLMLLSNLEVGTIPKWGTMNSAQMCKHCSNFIKLYLGEIEVSIFIRLIAKIIGRFFLIKILSQSPRVTPKNLNTLPSIKATAEKLEYTTEHSKLMILLKDVKELNGIIEHPLYGKMSSNDIKSLIRHHTAHHFNQFSLLLNLSS